MDRNGNRTVTQRQFLRHMEERASPVRYAYPGLFYTDRLEVRIAVEGERLGRFLEKLGGVLPFNAYDDLSREVWVAHLRAEDGAAYTSPSPDL